MDVKRAALLKLALGPSGTPPVAPAGGVGGGSGIIRPPTAAAAGPKITTPQMSMRTMTVGAQPKIAAEKRAIIGDAMLGGTIGATIGGIRAPTGYKGEGIGRGAGIGAGTGAGLTVGGAGGMLTGAALAHILSHLISGGRPDQSTVNIGMAGGGLTGAALGGYGGFKGVQNWLGKPSWEAKDKKKPKTAAAYAADLAKPEDDMERRVRLTHAIRTEAHLPKAVTAPAPQVKMSQAQRFAEGLAKTGFDMSQMGDMARSTWQGMGPTGQGAAMPDWAWAARCWLVPTKMAGRIIWRIWLWAASVVPA